MSPTTTVFADIATDTSYQGESERWHAVRRRDRNADGRFFFAVKTTGVYCRPSCGARPPKRGNVTFYETPDQAEAAGYRACKRCRPTSPSLQERHARIAAAACRQIESMEAEPSLQELADTAGMSRYHFNRVFKKIVGVTPKQYAVARRSQNVKRALRSGNNAVTDAIYAAGYGASSRFYESADARLGMTATAYRSGGRGVAIRYSVSRSWLGPVLIAATEKGLCAILFADSEEHLVADLKQRFQEASLEPAEAGSEFDGWVAQTLAFVAAPSQGLALPLDVRGTAFQERVWRALRAIPAGKTASYTDIAKRIGSPKSAQAVARACGANPTAVAIPCHRVVRSDGAISGYRWGVERKRKLLVREAS